MASTAKTELDHLRRAQDAKASLVKAEVGIFSEYGIAEVKDAFWSTFSGGKVIDRRHSREIDDDDSLLLLTTTTATTGLCEAAVDVGLTLQKPVVHLIQR